MSPENQFLEDVFPIEIVLFSGGRHSLVFGSVSPWRPTLEVFFGSNFRGKIEVGHPSEENHPPLGGWDPRTRKWLVTMVIVVVPLSRVMPLPSMALFWLINGVTNHLLTGMILQALGGWISS